MMPFINEPILFGFYEKTRRIQRCLLPIVGVQVELRIRRRQEAPGKQESPKGFAAPDEETAPLVVSSHLAKPTLAFKECESFSHFSRSRK